MQRLASYVSPARLARALGLGESTLKRWIDQGRIPAEKTPGGHRRIRLAVALRLLRGGDAPAADLAALGFTEPDETSPAALFAVLCSDAPELALPLLERLYATGVRVTELADRWIAPAMRRIGRGWESERIAVTTEHRATGLMLRALYGLQRAQPEAPARAPLAFIAGLSGDPYLLAPLCVQLALGELGFRTAGFGPDTPAASLCDAISERRPDVVALSFSVPGVSGQAAGAAVAAACRAAGTRLFVGGRGLAPDQARALTDAFWCQSLSDLARLTRRPGGVPSGPGAGSGRQGVAS